MLRVLAACVGSAALAPAIAAQKLSEQDAIAFARSRAALALDRPAGEFGAPRTQWYSPRSVRHSWFVTFADGTFVSVRDENPPGSWWVYGSAPNLFNLQDVAPFMPAYRTREEALEHALAIAARLGMSDFTPSPTSPPTIPVPARDGTVRSRQTFFNLSPTPYGYGATNGGNRIQLSFDALDYALAELHVVEGYDYERPTGPPITAHEAELAVRRVVDVGEVRRISGPYFYQVPRTEAVLSAGERYVGRKLVPLVYSVIGTENVGYVHAVSGEVLCYRSGLLASGGAKAATTVRPSAGTAERSAPRAGPAAAAVAKRQDAAPHSSEATVRTRWGWLGAALACAAGGWLLLRWRARASRRARCYRRRTRSTGRGRH